MNRQTDARQHRPDDQECVDSERSPEISRWNFGVGLISRIAFTVVRTSSMMRHTPASHRDSFPGDREAVGSSAKMTNNSDESQVGQPDPKINPYQKIYESLREDFQAIAADIEISLPPGLLPKGENPQVRSPGILDDMRLRLRSIGRQVVRTIDTNPDEIERSVIQFLQWMNDGTIVRVIGAGRARLAASIPAQRLAHGGARVYIQDDMTPMPHTIHGGGLLVASASGTTRSVISTIESARMNTRDLRVIGIALPPKPLAAPPERDSVARQTYEHIKPLCDIFICIAEEAGDAPNPLRALADAEEYVISELLDAMVVAAGKLGGYPDARWQLGHEDIASTGFYDYQQHGTR